MRANRVGHSPGILYNAAGFLGSGDAASGSKLQTGLVALLFAVLTMAAFYGSYRSFRAALSKRDVKG